MFIIIGADGKQYGPVPADKVQAWMRDGRANLETRAQRQGETEWRTLGDYAEFTAAAATPPPLAGAAPVEPDSALPAGPVDARTYAAVLIARADALDPFECLSRSFQVWKTHFGSVVGAVLLATLAQTALGFIPALGLVSGLFLQGVFYGGIFYYLLGKLRHEPREIGDVFAGFSRAFVPLMVTTLIVSAVSLVILLPALLPVLSFVVEILRNPGVTPTELPVVGPAFFGSLALALLALLYLNVSWVLAYPLVIDKRLSPLTALAVSWRVVNHQWFRVVFTLLCSYILTLLGLLALFIGFFFTLPLMYLGVVCVYEALCNPPPRPAPIPEHPAA